MLRKYSNLSNRKTLKKGIYISLIMIAVRPLIDFFPSLREAAIINIGGLWGAIVFLAIISLFSVYIWSKKNLKYSYIIMLGPLVMIFCFYVINLIILKSTGIIVDISRFLIGFSPFLLIPIIMELSGKINSKKIFRTFYLIFALSLIPSVVITFLQFFEIWEGLYGLYGGQERATGGYFHPGHFGRFILMFTFFSYIAILKNLFSKRFVYFLILTGWIATFFSGHRTSLALISLIVLSGELFRVKEFLFTSFKLKKSKMMYKISGFILIIVVLIISLPTVFEAEQMQTMLHQNLRSFRNIPDRIMVDDQIFDDRFLNNRGLRWNRVVNFMNDQPRYVKIIGYGETIHDAHNELLHRYLNSGILGIVLLYGIFFPLLLVFMIKSSDKKGRYLSLLLLICYVFFGVPLRPSNYPNFMWLFFTGLIFILLLCNKTQKSDELRYNRKVQ